MSISGACARRADLVVRMISASVSSARSASIAHIVSQRDGEVQVGRLAQLLGEVGEPAALGGARRRRRRTRAGGRCASAAPSPSARGRRAGGEVEQLAGERRRAAPGRRSGPARSGGLSSAVTSASGSPLRWASSSARALSASTSSPWPAKCRTFASRACELGGQRVVATRVQRGLEQRDALGVDRAGLRVAHRAAERGVGERLGETVRAGELRRRARTSRRPRASPPRDSAPPSASSSAQRRSSSPAVQPLERVPVVRGGLLVGERGGRRVARPAPRSRRPCRRGRGGGSRSSGGRARRARRGRPPPARARSGGARARGGSCSGARTASRARARARRRSGRRRPRPRRSAPRRPPPRARR